VKIWGQEPVYGVWETEATGKIFSISWFHEVEPPHRAGKAIRIRIRTKAIHFGVCGKAKRPIFRETDKGIEEIKSWEYESED
jgi:hypothetical protein